MNRFFVLSFEHSALRDSNKRYLFSILEITDYNIMTDGKTTFDQPVKSDVRTYKNVAKLLLIKEMGKGQVG